MTTFEIALAIAIAPLTAVGVDSVHEVGIPLVESVPRVTRPFRVPAVPSPVPTTAVLSCSA